MFKQQLSILVADDDEGDRKQIRRALMGTNLKCKIIEVDHMQEAHDACHETSFDCVILDYQMPGQDGLEGVSQLHEKFPYMPILMATGQGDEMVASEAFKRGASDYIIKRNISSESIRRVIRNVLEKAALQHQIDEQRQALENFAHMLVHDLSAPIQLMCGFSGLISKAVESAEYEDLQSYCEHLEDSGTRMQELIETLSEYNKVSGGQVTFEPVSLSDILNKAADNLSIFVKDRNAKITFDELPTITGNGPQLTQLFQNLIGNGIKYCDEKTPHVHVTAREGEDGWVIGVKDNGIGIPPQFSDIIFSPFKRLHSRKDSKYSGTGLGLATCKKIVERHNGSIWCESMPKEGSSFYFTLTKED